MTQATMTQVVCPHCGATVPENELAEEWCEACGKHLPAWFLRTLPHPKARRARTAGTADLTANPARAGRPCDLCGVTTLDGQPCYLRASGSAGPAVRCWLCAGCYDRGREIRTNRRVVAGWAAVAVALAGAAVVGVLNLGLGPRTETILLMGVFGLLALNSALCLGYLLVAPARQTAAWLGRVDPALRSLLGVREWGWRTAVRVVHTAPAGPAVELADVTKPAATTG